MSAEFARALITNLGKGIEVAISNRDFALVNSLEAYRAAIEKTMRDLGHTL